MICCNPIEQGSYLMSDKIATPLAAALLAAGLTLGSAAGASAATPAKLDHGASVPMVSSLLAMDEQGRLIVDEKTFDDAVLASEFGEDALQQLADIIIITNDGCTVNAVAGCGGNGIFA